MRSVNNSWVDTHCHLFALAGDPQPVITRAEAAGVGWIVCPGIDAQTSHQALELRDRHEIVAAATAGLHPHDAAKWPVERDRIAELAAEADAVGECGLDFYRNLAPRDDQIAAFRDQLQLAVQLGKPAIVHCRDAFAEVYAEVETAGIGPDTVLHCWTGGPRWTKRFRDLGVTFSFAGPITFATGDTVRFGAAEAPPDRTMVETDTPYLTPPPHRHRPNEPSNVVTVGEALAQVWGVDPAEVARSTSQRAAEVFTR